MILIIDDYLFLAGGLISAVLGIAHIISTSAILRMFGDISENNRRMLTMSWIAEGLALVFIGGIVCLTVAIAGTENDAIRVVTWSAAAAMFFFAIINLFIAFKTSIFAVKAGVFVNGIAGLLFLIGSFINS